MPYEIRVVFQTVEAYQSAVDRLYAVFGVALPAPEPSSNGAAEPAGDSTRTTLDVPDRDVDEDPPLGLESYSFVVEDRTR